MPRKYSTVDRIGELRAAIAEIQDELKPLEDALKARGAGSYEGHVFRVTVVESERKSVSWRAVAEAMGDVPEFLVTKHTSYSFTTSLRPVARLKSAA